MRDRWGSHAWWVAFPPRGAGREAPGRCPGLCGDAAPFGGACGSNRTVNEDQSAVVALRTNRGGPTGRRENRPVVVDFKQLDEGSPRYALMPSYLSRVHVHLVWTTSRRTPFITPDIEAAVHEQIVLAAQARRCHVLAMGGIEEHVHLLVWLHPGCSIAKLVEVAKTTSSRTVHATLGRPFRWQTGYGAFAVQPRAVHAVIAYIRAQREHHERGTTIELLEQTPRS